MNTVFVENIKDIDLDHTFLCGQCFRFEKEEDNSYTIVAHGRVINVKKERGGVLIKNSSREDFENIWRHYFDLDRDYDEIRKSLSDEKEMEKALSFGRGIKILNQEPFETLISFIISSNNQIPRIKKIIASLCELLGDEIIYEGKVYYSFPTFEKLKDVSDLSQIRAGFRDKYILDAVSKLKDGYISLDKIKEMDTDSARSELMKIKGVGPKVSDCVLLFAFEKTDAFPVDTWISKIIYKIYKKKLTSPKEIKAFLNNHYGKYAGFAQQYLFFYARENKIF